jgi:hypothetical protein
MATSYMTSETLMGSWRDYKRGLQMRWEEWDRLTNEQLDYWKDKGITRTCSESEWRDELNNRPSKEGHVFRQMKSRLMCLGIRNMTECRFVSRETQ